MTESCDERHRDCLLPEVSSQRTPGPCWEQLSADLTEISQRKHGLRPCQVLGQAAVSHFGIRPSAAELCSILSVENRGGALFAP